MKKKSNNNQNHFSMEFINLKKILLPIPSNNAKFCWIFPVFFGFDALDLLKLLSYELYYDYLKP